MQLPDAIQSNTKFITYLLRVPSRINENLQFSYMLDLSKQSRTRWASETHFKSMSLHFFF